MRTAIIAAASSLALLVSPAEAEDQVKIGFIATLSGNGAPLGQDLLDGFNLGVKHAQGRLGGLHTEVIVGDDQLKPEIGRELALKMVERDRVDIITGIVFSNVMLALAKPVLDSGTFLISANAGPSELAGKGCHKNFFNVSWQNDNTHEAMGHYLKEKGVKSVFLLAPNYPAGTDALTGFKRYYAGQIAGELYTKLGQPDYGAELAQIRAAAPQATFAFYPGGMAVNFVKQYAQAGLKETIPLYGPSFLLDQTSLPAQGEAAVGMFNTSFWSPDLQNPKNQTFVADFRADFGRVPSGFAAQGYDAAQLIDSAIRAVGGKLGDKDAFRKALEEAAFTSVRGPFKFNKNHFPIQNFYLCEVVLGADGTPINRTVSIVFEGHGDAYAKECRM
jgi:branched-chain amino acid transport system substrate-binding protein